MQASKFIVCEHCDVVYQRADLARKQTALCVRCGAELYRGPTMQLQTMLALVVTSLVVFVIANVYPLVAMDMHGVENHSTLLGAIGAAWNTGVGSIAVLAALTVFLFPLTQILLLGYLLGSLLILHRKPFGFIDIMHALRLMRPWSMVEVFLIGALVAVVKIAGMAEVHAEPGLYALGVLTFLLTVVNAFDLRLLWDARERLPE
ncbi:paraquat-inducible protein A [Solimonas terrae]|uniref:Paraquat-inducible protein A n=1 Tax=Solimonas terrae TaxID=1396819 RepID=A0A6M2BR27_9GAMM|nr:paraquat-inducible protein A [Solimonas terrae]NGY04685.1 paraquat-inducible protein A [Solimonas terrae]